MRLAFAVVLMFGGVAAANPTYSTIKCSTSGATGYVTGTLANFACSSASGCTTSTLTYQLAGACAGEFNDADVWISGWKWNWRGGEHSVKKFKLGVASSSFNAGTQELSFSLEVQALSATGTTDEGELTLYFQIIATTMAPTVIYSQLVRWNQGCSDTGIGSCQSTATFVSAHDRPLSPATRSNGLRSRRPTAARASTRTSCALM